MREHLLKQAKKRYTLGVVYEPDKVDSQGDYADAEEIEKACWNYMRRLQGDRKLTKRAMTALAQIKKALETGSGRVDVTEVFEEIQKATGPLGDMHTAWDDSLGDVVECYVTQTDQVIGGETVKRGSWMLGVVWSPDYFQKIERGERTGFSMGGRAKRIDG